MPPGRGAGMAAVPLVVALPAADPWRLRQTLSLLAGLALGDLGVEGLVAVHGDGLLDEALHGLEEVALFGGDEGERRAAFACTRRAADAVDVAFGLDWKLHVDDEVHVRHVDAAARDVRGHEDAHLAVLEALQGARALVLRLVRVDRRHGDVALAQLALDAVCAVARAREDDHAEPLVVAFEEVDEEVVLVSLLHEHALLVDLLDRRRFRGDGDLHRVDHQFAGELEDLRREGGAEEERLARRAAVAVGSRH